ncbi:EMB2745 [Symbiodinium sp. CCMP2592]|nr:EMB2745 [Symbiodinium sp. CCMP2592]
MGRLTCGRDRSCYVVLDGIFSQPSVRFGVCSRSRARPRPDRAASSLLQGGRCADPVTKDVRMQSSGRRGRLCLQARSESGSWQRALVSLALPGSDLQARHSLKQYGVGITSCGNAAEWRHAVQLAKEILVDHIELDTVACSAVATACQRAAFWRGALRSLSQIADLGLQDDVMVQNALSRLGRWQLAVLTFAALKSGGLRGLRPDAYSLGVTLAALGSDERHVSQRSQSGPWRWASKLLAVAGAALLRANSVCKNTALDVFAGASQWLAGLQLLKNWVMQRGGVDVIALTSAIQACGAAPNCEQALALLKRSCDDPDFPDPDLIMFNAVIHSLAGKGEWQRAFALLFEVDARRMRPDVATYTSAIGSCRLAGAWQQALLMYARARSRKVHVARVCSAVLMVCEQSGRWQQAVALLSEVAMYVPPVVDILCCNIALGSCDKASVRQRALQLLDSFSEWLVQPDACSYNTVVSSLGKAAGWQQAFHRLDDMMDKQLLPDAISCASLISTSEAARWTNALSLVQVGSLDRQSDVILFNSAISAIEQVQKWRRALGLADEICRINLRHDEFTYSATASACATAAVWKHALAVLNSMDFLQAADASASGESASACLIYACNAAVAACEPASQWQLASGLLRYTWARNLAPDAITLNTAMRCCRRTRRWQGTCELLMDAAELRIPATVVLCGDAVALCEEAERWYAARCILGRIEKFGLSPVMLLR